jgi:hypothetical protein
MILRDLRHQGGPCFGILNAVRSKGRAGFRNKRRGGLFIRSGEDHPCAIQHKTAHRARANARCAAGYQRNLSFESLCHARSPFIPFRELAYFM